MSNPEEISLRISKSIGDILDGEEMRIIDFMKILSINSMQILTYISDKGDIPLSDILEKHISALIEIAKKHQEVKDGG
jgi:hypothetical protein